MNLHRCMLNDQGDIWWALSEHHLSWIFQKDTTSHWRWISETPRSMMLLLTTKRNFGSMGTNMASISITLVHSTAFMFLKVIQSPLIEQLLLKHWIGILDFYGTNWIAVEIWARQATGAHLINFTLEAGVPVMTSYEAQRMCHGRVIVGELVLTEDKYDIEWNTKLTCSKTNILRPRMQPFVFIYEKDCDYLPFYIYCLVFPRPFDNWLADQNIKGASAAEVTILPFPTTSSSLLFNSFCGI